MTTVHVLGNGPSIQHFETDLFHTEPTDGIRIGCNICHQHLTPAWTFITTRPLFWLCTHDYPFTIPLCVTEDSLLALRDVLPDPNRLREFEYWQVIEQRPNTKQGIRANFSSGHMATAQALQTYNPTTLHLWGFDFMWTRSAQSWHDAFTEKLMAGDSGFTKRKTIHGNVWWSFWIEIFTTNSKTQFVIHTPVPIKSLPKNVITERL